MIVCGASGDLQSTLYYSSLTSRLIFKLKAHTTIPSTPVGSNLSCYTHHLRSLFWLFFVIDTELSIRTNQPPTIQAEYCDLTLPMAYEEQINTLLASNLSDDRALEGSLYPSDLRLTKIKSRTYRTLYAPHLLHKPDAEYLKLIRELDSDLEAWRLSIPVSCRPSLFGSRRCVLETHSRAGTLPVMLWMDYHHCLAMIHHAVSRCKAWTVSKLNMPDYMGSSFAIAVETSRSCIYSLESALSVLPRGCFWYVSLMMSFSCSKCLDHAGKYIRADLYHALCILPGVRRTHDLLQYSPRSSQKRG